MSSENELEDIDEIPLQHKRPFGSGLRRNEIAFVPASDGDLNTSDETTKTKKPAQNISDLYLSVVLPNEKSRSVSPQIGHDQGSASNTPLQVCPVCKLPLSEGRDTADDSLSGVALHPKTAHELSLAHQVCLSHSHPPSALDRSRMGLAYLEAYGWDPDARVGLGAAQQGIQFPIKPTPKDDTLGLGAVIPKDVPKKKEKPQQLDAGKVRKKALEDKKKTERLHRYFYSDRDLEKYLGPEI
ncbi:hypothetical protein VTK73DRAFT_9581 [Phialemonium thermophilum]|uniref:G-patch domain-containing protein n=1 Tax=Phialemonium thermophilum TaxID=223376 RepID=A0ABR3XK56_9PEZI